MENTTGKENEKAKRHFAQFENAIEVLRFFLADSEIKRKGGADSGDIDS